MTHTVEQLEKMLKEAKSNANPYKGKEWQDLQKLYKKFYAGRGVKMKINVSIIAIPVLGDFNNSNVTLECDYYNIVDPPKVSKLIKQNLKKHATILERLNQKVAIFAKKNNLERLNVWQQLDWSNCA